MSTQVAKHVSDLGNQHNNGPHQDQIFDNPSALCLALVPQNRIRLRRGLMHSFYEGSRTLYFFFFPVGFTLFKVYQM